MKFSVMFAPWEMWNDIHDIPEVVYRPARKLGNELDAKDSTIPPLDYRLCLVSRSD